MITGVLSYLFPSVFLTFSCEITRSNVPGDQSFPLFLQILNLVLVLEGIFKEDQLKKFIFQNLKIIRPFTFQSPTFYEQIFLRGGSTNHRFFILLCLISVSKAQDERPQARSTHPSPHQLLVCALPARCGSTEASSLSFHTQQGAVRGPHPATFGRSHLLLSASPPTPFNLRIIADREGGAGGCLARIMVT